MSKLNSDQYLNELHWRRSAARVEELQRPFSHVDQHYMKTLIKTMGIKHTIPNISNANYKSMAPYLAN